MDVLPLPPQPDAARYRERARELSEACKSRGDDGIREWATLWVNDALPLTGRTPSPRELEFLVSKVAAYAQHELRASDCALTKAESLIARAHGFSGWAAFAQCLDDLTVDSSGTARFEQAVEAIIAGDIDTLRTLITTSPELVHARSAREHGATLLHYVAANGVENYRQKTPANIVDIARLLLEAGAEVDAEAGMYGGGATTLGLAVTSAHPRQRGVQIPLAELLLERGARLYPSIIRDCLANGCPEAAVYLAERGAQLDFEGAAGTGNVARARELLDAGLSLSSEDVNRGVNMAVWYNRTPIVALLLDYGMDPATMTRWDKERRTILHLAAWCGHAEMSLLLIARGAPVNIRDETWHTNPLTWALHGWLVDRHGADEEYRVIVPALARAGATVDPEYLDQPHLAEFPDVLALLREKAT